MRPKRRQKSELSCRQCQINCELNPKRQLVFQPCVFQPGIFRQEVEYFVLEMQSCLYLLPKLLPKQTRSRHWGLRTRMYTQMSEIEHRQQS